MSEEQKTPEEIAREAAIEALAAKEADLEELAGPITTLTQLTVLVIRDQMAKVPAQVFEHELPILFHLFGEDGVEVNDSKTRTVQVANFNVDAEFERLQRKYKHNDAASVRAVYGDSARQLAEELGLKSELKSRGANRRRQEQQNMEVDHSAESETKPAVAQARIVPLQRVASKGPKPVATAKTTTKRIEKAKESSPKSKPRKPATKSAK